MEKMQSKSARNFSIKARLKIPNQGLMKIYLSMSAQNSPIEICQKIFNQCSIDPDQFFNHEHDRDR